MLPLTQVPILWEIHRPTQVFWMFAQKHKQVTCNDSIRSAEGLSLWGKTDGREGEEVHLFSFQNINWTFKHQQTQSFFMMTLRQLSWSQKPLSNPAILSIKQTYWSLGERYHWDEWCGWSPRVELSLSRRTFWWLQHLIYFHIFINET